MNIDDQAFLDQIEQNIRGKDNEQDVARREAEQRALEMERIRKASANLPKPGVPKPKAATPEKKNPLEDDPRYKEYFERLKKQKGITTPPSGTSNVATAPAAAAATAAAPGRSDSQVVGPGAIVRFDDGSIGVYKDAVSGRDYALFYFLQPDGQFVPKGVFLQSYQAKVIGNLPENYFAEQRDNSAWNRDQILYHLARFEHSELLNNVAEHKERKPKNATPAKSPAPSQPVPAQNSEQIQSQAPVQESSTPTPVTPAPAQSAPAASANPLVKGRKFQIVFGGKKWEAVYWTSDENGSIVAHATHGHWSLMRLDLDRFKDSLELGDVVDSELMDKIATDAAGSK